MASPLRYFDFGFSSAQDYWAEVVLTAVERFEQEPSRANAIGAALLLWNVLEWVWHDQNPGEAASGMAFDNFRGAHFSSCPELELIRDVAEAGKHRGLGRRSVIVKKVADKELITGPIGTVALNTLAIGEIRISRTPLLLTLDNETVKGFKDVLARSTEYWKRKFSTQNPVRLECDGTGSNRPSVV